MEEANLHVEVHEAGLPVEVAKSAWLAFIRNKTWSEFSMCTDEEMTQGNQSNYLSINLLMCQYANQLAS